ncbi:MAG: HAD-IC family P-type ATPase [Eubacterium sp.]|nr:HAD-IC family P-type ATPase [Eubacterium sp.]
MKPKKTHRKKSLKKIRKIRNKGIKQNIFGYTGLTSEEVARLIREGKSNHIPNQSSQSVGSIYFNNIVTYFNAIFFGLTVLIIAVGAYYRNLTFLPVVIANIVIGIVQQLKAKKVLDELSLLDKTEYMVVRDGVKQKIDTDKLVLGDTILFVSGQQIPADAEVISGKVSVNESLLTGESDEIEKEEGAPLMSGSFVVSGECLAKLTHVGADSYAAKLTSKAKEVKNKKSEMIKDIETIIKFAGIVIIPVGILMVINSVVISGRTLEDGVVSMVGAVVGMIPEGLYLLLTVALTMSAARLAMKKVLLHDMKSIETLARVDVLCVDKTGTITNEVMTVTGIFPPAGKRDEASLGDVLEKEVGKVPEDENWTAGDFYDEEMSEEDIDYLTGFSRLLSRYVHTIPDTNITMLALRNHFLDPAALEAVNMMPFSSATKYSEIHTKKAAYRLGAPEYLLSEEQLAENKQNIEKYTGKGQRVLAFVLLEDNPEDGRNHKSGQRGNAAETDLAKEADKVTPLLFVSLANEIRETAPETFSYFAEQGVKIKVISGDNPLTVSKVALAANIEGAESYVDATTLETEEDYLDAVKKYTVFGRVKPEQKKSLIEAIKKNGERVAMTGDGVNDILAMKEADCSIAMGGGSDAARQAAQVVLLDSDFSHMMQIVSEGRRIINNMTRSGILFLYKNIFSLLLAIFTIVLSLHYPLRPTQVALISMFNIGLPGFLLAMENNTKRQRGRLLTRTLKGAFPASLLSFVLVSVLVYVAPIFELTDDEVGVATTYLLSAVGFILLWKIIRPLNRYRIVVFALCIAGMVLSVLFLWNIFIIADISVKGNLFALLYGLVGAAIMFVLTNLLSRRDATNEGE